MPETVVKSGEIAGERFATDIRSRTQVAAGVVVLPDGEAAKLRAGENCPDYGFEILRLKFLRPLSGGGIVRAVRLAFVEKEVEESSGDGDMILPSRTALELRRLLSEEGMAELEISERHIRVRFSDTLLYSKLIEGTYPNFRQIIPGSFQKTLDIPRDAVMQTLDLLAVPLTADISNLKLTFKRGELEFFSRNDTVGEGKDRLEVAYDYDDPLEITFNYQLLQAPFRYVREDQFRLQMNGANGPVMIEDGKGFHYILMPLRVK